MHEGSSDRVQAIRTRRPSALPPLTEFSAEVAVGADAEVDLRGLVGIHPAGWYPFRYPLRIDPDCPATVQKIVMMVFAKECEVVEVGFAAVDPGNDVVPFAVFGGDVARPESCIRDPGRSTPTSGCGSRSVSSGPNRGRRRR